MSNLQIHNRVFLRLVLPALVCACTFMPDTAFAQSGQISELFLDAAEQFDASQIPDSSDSKRAVIKRSSELVDYLTRKTDQRNRDAWLRYLDLEPLVEAIDEDDSPNTIGREAVALRQRLIGIAPGLEFSRFRRLRDAVEQLIPAMRYRDKAKTTKYLSKKLEDVAEDLAEMHGVPTVDEMSTLNDTLKLLSDTNQALQVQDQLEMRFGHNNIAVWVDESVVQRFVSRPVNQTQAVNDCILGTRLIGSASLNGLVSANLLPMQGAIALNVSMQAQVTNSNRGFRKPITLTTSGCGSVYASRNIFINESGISMDATCVDAQLRTQIDSIQHRFRFVRRIARRKAAEQKPQADRIGVDKLRRQVAEQFTKQTNEATNLPKVDLMAKARPYLLRLDIPEPTRSIGSTEQSIYLQTKIRRDNQLASPVPPPPIAAPYEAAIQIHESAINNSIGYLLAGRTMTQAQIDQMMAQSGRPPLAASGSGTSVLDTDDEGDEAKEEAPFEIDFAASRPIIFEAREGKIRVGVRGTRFAQGSRALKRSLEITALYAPARTADGAVILIRDGEVDIDFPGKKRLSIAQAGMKEPIKKNFANVFPDTLMNQPLTVPMTVKNEAFRGRVYRPRDLQAENGWLTVLLR